MENSALNNLKVGEQLVEMQECTLHDMNVIEVTLYKCVSILGFKKDAEPSFLIFSMFSLIASYIESCIEGTKRIGVLCPCAVIKRVEIGLSAILYANLEIVFAVAGATSIKSS